MSENEDEIAIVMSIALLDRYQEPKQHSYKTNNWHKNIDSKMPISWSRTYGWKNISRHESVKGTKG